MIGFLRINRPVLVHVIILKFYLAPRYIDTFHSNKKLTEIDKGNEKYLLYLWFKSILGIRENHNSCFFLKDPRFRSISMKKKLYNFDMFQTIIVNQHR